MGGIFSTVLNVAGAVFVGDPALGSQIAAKAGPGYAPVNQTPEEIAAQVMPDVRQAFTGGGALPSSTGISPQAQQIGAAVAKDVALALKADGVMLPAGTLGAELQKPTVLNAFGGQNAKWVMVGGLALGALLFFKEG